MVDVLGEQSYGQAQVVQPETSGAMLNQYTTYLVQVKLGDDSYNARKRYSDFEWLRSALVACFPGVRVPPLPKKHSTAGGLIAKTGRADDAFIEARRAGLEDFLRSVLRRRQLCVDSQILKRFLATNTEEAFEELKTKIDNVSLASKCLKYGQIFADLKEAGMPADDRIMLTKTFLTEQRTELREVADGFKEVVDAQQAFTRALSGTQAKLATMSARESNTLSSAGMSNQARVELVSGLRHQNDAMHAFPSWILLASAERELLETEAMLEALDSVENLQTSLQETQARLESLNATLKQVIAGGEIPSSGTGVARMLGMAKPRSREEKIAEMKAELAQKQTDAATMEEWYQLARIVLVRSEIDAFYKEKVARNSHTKDSFGALSQKAAERLMGAWAGTGAGTAVPTTPTQGYLAAEPELADDEFE